ncbi:glycosyltransferase family 4 protein [Cloacibacterium caeni]|uniref:glycosyltransferase family 4 protein n=1 Tax=Cloacibacterium caeni TaxID=2004710 RepID=UPI001BCEB278|nr:glycosyltransferase family 4 protein [Cloacibacterium caeni]
MKILLVTQYFYPENFKGNDIAFEMQKKGHEVTVLTGIPNYPKGKFFKGYGYFKRRRETVNGVKVIRTFLIPRGNSTAIPLMVNYFTWFIFASFYAVYLALSKKFDKIIVQQLSPVMMGLPAVVVKKIQKIPVYFWVLDLWPESLESAGGIKNKKILGFFESMVKFLYRNSDKILISSKGFKQSILKKGNFEDKIIYFPNWAEKSINESKQNVEINLPKFPSGFNILFAGNVGVAQDLVNAIKAMEIVLKQNKKINFLILGDGRDRKRLEKLVLEKNIEKNIHFFGKYPIETMSYFFSKADCMFVSLKNEPIFSLSLPAKVQAYMSVGKPIISMMNGEGYNIINEADCGFAVHAEDYKDLADKILEIEKLPVLERQRLGENGKSFYQENFVLENCISNLEKIIS